MNKPNPIADKSFKFAIQIVNLCKDLSKNQHEFVLSKQLLRSGTAVGALVREAQNAESKKDFIHKLAISQKECDESIYWVDLLFETKYITEKVKIELKDEATQLLKLLRSIIISTKRNL